MYETEKKVWLQAAWILPLAAMVAAAGVGSWLWPLAEGVDKWPSFSWSAGFHRPYLLLPAAALAAVATWRFLLRCAERNPRGWPRWAAVPLALLMLGSVEFVFRLPAVQQPFWMAIRTYNPGEAGSVARELALLKLDRRARDSDGRPAVVVAGTSQMILGIDYAELRRRLPGTDVRRSSLAGMVPLRMVLARPELNVQAGNRVIMYVSAFDLFAFNRLNADWIRPVATWEGTADWWPLLPEGAARGDWRHAADVAFASTLELWSARDYLRFCVLGRDREKTAAPGMVAREPAGAPARDGVDALHREQFKNIPAEDPYYGANLAALDLLVSRFRAKGAHVVIFEGQVNPVLHSSSFWNLHQRLRAHLESLAQAGLIRFVPIESQSPAIEAGDWKDGTHFNERGRDKFTACVANCLKGSP